MIHIPINLWHEYVKNNRVRAFNSADNYFLFSSKELNTLVMFGGRLFTATKNAHEEKVTLVKWSDDANSNS